LHIGTSLRKFVLEIKQFIIQLTSIMNTIIEKPYVVGIDIGGTNTVFGIVDARGTIIASDAVKTASYPTADEYADAVCAGLKKLLRQTVEQTRLKVSVSVLLTATTTAELSNLLLTFLGRVLSIGCYVRKTFGYSYRTDK
jgi:hypothetical protein